MKSALALLAALVGVACLVVLGCTAPLAGAPCPCLTGFECDEPAQICRPIGADGSPSSVDADRAPSDAGSPFADSSLDPADSGGGSADSGFSDAGSFAPDAS